MYEKRVPGTEGTTSESSLQAPIATPSSLPNVYHIVFDEFQTEMFETTLDSELKGALAGFIFFHDARTEWGRTQMSMASIFAPTSYDYETNPLDFVDSACFVDPIRALNCSAGLDTHNGLHEFRVDLPFAAPVRPDNVVQRSSPIRSGLQLRPAGRIFVGVFQSPWFDRQAPDLTGRL